MHMGISMLPYWSAFLLLFVLSTSATEIVTIDVASAKDLIHTGYLYLDIRTVKEFMEGHVHAPNIINIPYMLKWTPEDRVKNTDFLKEVSSAFKKEDYIIVGCKLGVRSVNATVDLLADGFKNVKNMGGGYVDWVKNKFPVIIPEAKEEL